MNNSFFGASLIAPAVEWLERDGVDPRRMTADAEQDLRRRGRHLPRERRAQYFQSVLLGQFFARWAKKHHRRPLKTLIEDSDLCGQEMRPFELALIAAGDERTFRRIIPRFVRKKIVQDAGLSIGNAEEFSGFVAENTRRMARLFLQNFKVDTPKAARKALRYLRMTAVSWYLVRRTRPIREDAPNLQAYLSKSRRMKPRTVLAVKLAYLPALLSPEERAALRDQYGLSGSIGKRMPIKDIAKLLGFANPAALSRKLYRVRDWCRRSAALPATEVAS